MKDYKLRDLLVSHTLGWYHLLVMDLLIDHDRFGSRSDPSINGHLHYSNV
jgi:hypothetical protein